MSHVINLDVRVKDPAILAEVAREKGLEVREQETVQFYSGTRTGMSVRLHGWNYPIVVDGEGTVHYDNWKGHWGSIQELHRLMQDYAVAVVKREALAEGAQVWQDVEEDGTVVLRVGVGGAW